ncbi:N-6 DNA methylase [Methylobacillus sp.]|uniref:N-6 DNA methylase n=1 Tax=Methylobacillus sp. TaxID=56818 RepID=UPI002FE2CB1F
MSEIMGITDHWLQRLGYHAAPGVLHRSVGDVRADHPYAREMTLMLRQDGDIRSSAVFEVDHVPAVCFVEAGNGISPNVIDEIRQKIWNQNLVSIVIVLEDENATAYPAPRNLTKPIKLTASDVGRDNPLCANSITSGAIFSELPDWFERRYRIDRVLQDNLSAVVELLVDEGLTKEQAQLLLGKCIFVSYLEHREIVGNRYREHHQFSTLLELLKSSDGQGLDKLFRQLKRDFNGDLLEIEGGANIDWKSLRHNILDLLTQFLLQTHIRQGQQSLWPYDFKHIPVELISGIYESFLGFQQRDSGAFYTPRHLAYLAVDEAFRGIAEPWKEVVLDGACGSGILLTSAYRRILGAKQSMQEKALSYSQRCEILLSSVRGSDISIAACKVTVFSLYLALLEDLAPADILQLQEDQKVKLPELIGSIIAKENTGDFFSPHNQVAQPGIASIVISNPPWFEPSDQERKSYEHWWTERFGQALPRRQIALAFARRATDLLRPGGRLCLILPASTLAASGANEYLRGWFKELAPERIYNLSDLRSLLFEGAIHPATIVTGVRRPTETSGSIPMRECFDYFVPKADVSFAFGRLTVHSADRKRLPTHTVCDDVEVLRTYFWGNELDESLIARLRIFGTLANHGFGENGRFIFCKGFHMTDRSKQPKTSEPLKAYPFLDTSFGNNAYPKNRYFVTNDDLTGFPASIMDVADYGSKSGQAFDGVRVIFPDGADQNTLEVRACYTDTPCCFTQSVGAIVDRKNDKDLMKFLTAYLRSKLASYLLFYTTFSLSMERPHVKMREIESLPFLMPSKHESPEKANNIIHKVVHLLDGHKEGYLSNNKDWQGARAIIDDLIFDYFGLNENERQVVRDTCQYYIPSRQPNTFAALSRPLHQKPQQGDLKDYTRVLHNELEVWRDRLSGEGTFTVKMAEPSMRRPDSMGIIRISLESESKRSNAFDRVFDDLLIELQDDNLYPVAGENAATVASDFLVYYKPDYYLVKPMLKRLWLSTAAVHDAYRIVQTVRRAPRG